MQISSDGLPSRQTIRRMMELPEDHGQSPIVVAMSGGVDSSVVAGLLRHAGYEVIGLTMQLYDHGQAVGAGGTCCAGRDIDDARYVAQQLEIPHYVLDYEARFRAEVIEPFAASYVDGQTPIPCVSCNQKLKFSDLLETARDLGAVALATGHYIGSRRGKNGRELYRPADHGRDQSYFLFNTTRGQLDYLRFPLAEYSKEEIRRFAEIMKFPVAAKADSQDICFIPTGHYSDLVTKLHPHATEPGDIIHVDGRRLGTHRGVVHYTVGQRRGLGIAAGEPLFVVRLNPQRAEVIVGPRAALKVQHIRLEQVNWLGEGELPKPESTPVPLHVRVRSTRAPVAAQLAQDAEGLKVTLLEHEEGVAPGQACVFYSDDGPRARLWGGGWISRTPAVGVA